MKRSSLLDRGLRKDMLSHGTRGRYTSGCRCSACRAANTAQYHRRQARALEAVSGGNVNQAPAAPLSRVYTAADGTTRRHVFKNPCPGIKGGACPKRSFVRKDSLGGICGRCRYLLAWDGLVPADRARRHIWALSRRGLGRRAVAESSDVAISTLYAVKAGTKKQIRASTERRILAVDVSCLADSAIVRADETHKRIAWLLGEGFSKAEIARRLGCRKPALQLGERGRVLVRTAARVERLVRSLELGA